jgi:hypothetical protein
LCIEIGRSRIGLRRERREPQVDRLNFDEQLKEVGNRKFRLNVVNAKSASFLRAF